MAQVLKRSRIPRPSADTSHHGLQLHTLSGLFEAAREVTRMSSISTCSTFDQLSRALAKVSKDKDKIKDLYYALERLEHHSLALGATTLVRPTDHPLVTRAMWEPEEQEG